MTLSEQREKIDKFFSSSQNYVFLKGDTRDILGYMPSESVDCVITSPPYWNQRDYLVEDEYHHLILGTESTHQEYVENLALIFSEMKRVLKSNGSLWLNLGDKYVNKNLMGIPWRVAIAMQDDGWILRNDIIWDQMKGTQSAKDRLRDMYEHVFHFVKNKKYYYDSDRIRIQPKKTPYNRGKITVSATGVTGKKYREQIASSSDLSENEKFEAMSALEKTIEKMRTGEIVDFRMTIRGLQRTYHSNNGKISGRAKELETKGFYILTVKSKGHLPSDIWRIVPEDKWRKDAHYAVFPEDLLIKPIEVSCPLNGIVLDPFCGIGSTACSALKLGRRAIGVDISEAYLNIAQNRTQETIQNVPSLLPLE